MCSSMLTPGGGGTGTAENTQGPIYRQASGRQRREDGAEQNNTNITKWTDNGEETNLRNSKIKNKH